MPRDSGGVKVVGLTKAVNALIKSGVDLGDLKAAFSKIAQIGVRAAERFAPVRTGNLRRSIRGSKAKSKAAVRAGGKSLPYVGPVHFGWPRRNISPQPFLHRAEAEIRPTVIPILEREIDSLLDKNF